MRALAALLDVFYPPRCAACRRLLDPRETPTFSSPLCEPCEDAIDPIEEACAGCGLPGREARCAACLSDPPAYDSVRSAFVFGTSVSEMLHRFKYEDHPELAGPLGLCIAGLELPEVDLVLAVPLHESRRRSRTYDQAFWLAKTVARARRLPLERRRLLRARATRTQVGRSRDERAVNVQDAFRVRGRLDGRRILLIDDVVTTGATTAECAIALKGAGAAQVHVASVARAL